MSFDPTRNVVFGWPRWTGLARDIFAPATLPGFGGANAFALPLARPVRFSLAPQRGIFWRLDRERPVRLVTLVRHNLSATARMRVQLFRGGGTQLVYATGFVDVWPESYPWPQPEWEDDFYWTGREPQENLTGINWTRPVLLPSVIGADALSIDIQDPDNPAGFLEIGLIDVAQGWQPSCNVSYGYQTGVRDRSGMVEAIGGARYFDRRDAPRRVRGEIQYLPRDEAMARAFEMLRRQGATDPMVWFPFPNRPRDWVRDAMLARLVDPGPLGMPVFDRMTFSFELEEAL